jgi:hypothetical protein
MKNTLTEKAMLVIVAAPMMAFAMGTSPDEEQSLYHVWTPEPALLTAISCEDNDFGCTHPDDLNRHRKVSLPAKVRTAICDLTRQTFEKQLYDGPAKYTDLFGPIYHLTIPDRNDLHLYAYQLNEIPSLSFRWVSIALFLYDTKIKVVSPVPALAKTDHQPYCPRPCIRFKDILGDQATEILLFTGHHRGTEADHILQHVLRIEPDLTLCEALTLGTGIFVPSAFPGDTLAERDGYVVRTTQKVNPGCAEVTVSLSRTKLDQGTHILGFETWKMQEDGRMHRAAKDVIGDDKHDYVFQDWRLN